MQACMLSPSRSHCTSVSASRSASVSLAPRRTNSAARRLNSSTSLVFQALLLAHGGLTTLGANVFSMAVVGSFVAAGVFRASRALRLSLAISVFLAACLGDLATYVTTSIQLAWAFPDPVGGFTASLAKFAGIFAITQIPLAITEGLLTVLVVNALLQSYAKFNDAVKRGELSHG